MQRAQHIALHRALQKASSHTDTQTHRHTDTQTQKHKATQTQKLHVTHDETKVFKRVSSAWRSIKKLNLEKVSAHFATLHPARIELAPSSV